MSILKVNNSFFTGDDLNIPNVSSTGVGASGALAQANADKLTRLIEKREPEFLKKVLGNDLYLLFKMGMTVVDPATPDPKWTTLAGYLVDPVLKVSVFANYVWWNWSRSNASSTTGNGEAISSKENAKSVSPIDHQVGVWNEMVYSLTELRSFVQLNSDIYPGYLPDEDVYTDQNTFNF